MQEGILTVFWHDAFMSAPLLLQFALCPVVLLSLLLITAPYGRHHRDGWGPCLPGRAAWFLMELPALIVLPVMVLAGPAGQVPAAWVPALLWLFHYAYRTLVYPALMRASDHSFPLLLVLFAIGFNVLNGYNNGTSLVASGQAGDPLLSPHFFVGATLFLAGFGIHAHSDHIIRQLRSPGEMTYRIPRGGLFRWVGSPQYLGEIVQWTGWAVLTWSGAGLAFALFTACNLVPRAISNDRWYRQTFDDYPEQRRILLPGLL